MNTDNLAFLLKIEGDSSGTYGCFYIVDLNNDGTSDSLIKRVINPQDSYGCNTYNKVNVQATQLLTTLNEIDYSTVNSGIGLKSFKFTKKPIKIDEKVIDDLKSTALFRRGSQMGLEMQLL